MTSVPLFFFLFSIDGPFRFGSGLLVRAERRFPGLLSDSVVQLLTFFALHGQHLQSSGRRMMGQEPFPDPVRRPRT